MSSLRTIHTILRAPNAQARPAALAARPRLAAAPAASVRTYHGSPGLRRPYKDDQDRESLKPKSTEGTKSDTDDAAAQTNTAFDPSTTRPEEEKEAATREASGGGGGRDRGSPLEVSGANQERSKPLGEEGGEEGGEEMKGSTRHEKSKASRSGSPEKRGKPPGL